jgi:6,7-dimethyl-8-ribityllumazine synthase
VDGLVAPGEIIGAVEGVVIGGETMDGEVIDGETVDGLMVPGVSCGAPV